MQNSIDDLQNFFFLLLKSVFLIVIQQSTNLVLLVIHIQFEKDCYYIIEICCIFNWKAFIWIFNLVLILFKPLKFIHKSNANIYQQTLQQTKKQYMAAKIFITGINPNLNGKNQN